MRGYSDKITHNKNLHVGVNRIKFSYRRHDTASRRQSLHGFTLIELLVVIAIIALLLAIIIPSLKIAKQKASMVSCLANQRGIILAWSTYTIENDGKIVNGYSWQPYMLSNGGPGCWVEPSQDENGAYQGNAVQDIPLAYRVNGLKKGLLFAYLETPDVFHCPGDMRFRKGTSRGNTPAYLLYRTYSIVDGAVANANLDGLEGYRTVKKVTEIKNSANKYILIEEAYDGWACNFNDASWNLNIQESRFWDPLGLYHNDSCTLSFADAHAERYKFKDFKTIEYFADREAYVNRYGDRPSASDNADLQFFLHNWPGLINKN